MEVKIVASIADRLNEAMLKRDMKQSQLVKITGIDKGAISSYCSGRYEPKDDKIFMLSKALMVNPAWLAGFDVPMIEEKPPEMDGKARQLAQIISQLNDQNLDRAIDLLSVLLQTQ